MPNEDAVKDLTLMRIFNNIKTNFNKVAEGNKIHPDCSIYLPDYEVEVPFFTYKVDERNPSEQTGHKPRPMYKDYEEEIEYLGQQFEVSVQFGIYGKNYERVNEERAWFEEFIQKQKSNVKQDIVKFFFTNQEEDETVEINDNYYIKQTIEYYLVHQRIYSIPMDLIHFDSIETHLGRFDPYDDLMPKQ